MAQADAKQEFAIIGLGRFGTSLALDLIRLGHEVLAVDRNRELVQELADDLTQTVALDATDEAALRSVGIDSFETAVVAIGDDFESSVLITALLKEIGVRRVICKAITERQKHILMLVGADEVILPEHEAGLRLAQRLSQPNLIDHLELEPGFGVTQMCVPDAMVGRSLRDLDLTGRYGVMVLVIKGRRLRVVPRADEVLETGDTLVVLGPDAGIEALHNWEP